MMISADLAGAAKSGTRIAEPKSGSWMIAH
jgi:hypothetical protein